MEIYLYLQAGSLPAERLTVLVKMLGVSKQRAEVKGKVLIKKDIEYTILIGSRN
jgi:hypothetical protein